MSQTAHIPSHRKLRSAVRNPLLRPGVAGGVLSTLAVTASAAPASAEEQTATGTVETHVLTAALATGAQEAAEATRSIAVQHQIEAAQTRAAEKARFQAGKDAEAKAKAKAEAKREAAEAARKAAAEERAAEDRAARDARRTPLSATTSTTGPSSAAPTGSGNVATLVNFVRAQVGKSYVLGASGPNAYDCSGLTQTAFRQIGVSLPRTSQPQSTTGTPVSLGSLKAGDLLYWGSAGSAYHIAVYIGDGKYVGAQNPSTGVVERDLSYDMPTGAVRVL